MRKAIATLAGLFALGFSSIAMAHPDHVGLSMQAGFSHPLGGIDHLLAAIAVGVFAMSLSRTDRWLTPITFVAVLATAVLLPHWLPAKIADTGSIALLALVVGVMIVRMHVPRMVSTIAIALLAILQGAAHSSVLPTGANKIEFAFGLACTTAAICLLSSVVTLAVKRLHMPQQLTATSEGEARG